MTEFLAVWGAITGTIGVGLAAWALIWQIRTRREAPTPNLYVELSMMADKHWLFGGGGMGVTEAVLVQVTNRGPLPVNVAATGFLMQGNEAQELTFGNMVQPRLPTAVGPQSGLSLLLPYLSARRAAALSKPVIAWVKTDTGHRFLSVPTQVIRPGTKGYEDNLEPLRVQPLDQ